jgi:hypothetical protein
MPVSTSTKVSLWAGVSVKDANVPVTVQRKRVDRVDEGHELRRLQVLATIVERLRRADGHHLGPPLRMSPRIADDLPHVLDRGLDQSLMAIWAGHEQILKEGHVGGQDLAAVVGDEHVVLDPDAAEVEHPVDTVPVD